MKFIFRLLRYSSFSVGILGLSSFYFMLPIAADTVISRDNILDTIELPALNDQDTSGICSNQIEPIIDQIIKRPNLAKGKWAILVQSLGGSNVYSLNPDSYMVPASNIKLLVTAAALQKLNLSSQIRSTSIKDWITITNQQSDNAYANVLLS